MPALPLCRYGRCSSNCVRTIPWLSTIGFVLSVGGAAASYNAGSTVLNALQPYADTADIALRLNLFLWLIVVADIGMLAVGVFSTGRCREWCCRTPSNRVRGKFSCRSCCRYSYTCNSGLLLFSYSLVSLATFAFALMSVSLVSGKYILDNVCEPDQQVYIQSPFALSFSA